MHSITTTLVKLAEDLMQKEKIIVDDNKDVCRGISIIPRNEMKNFRVF